MPEMPEIETIRRSLEPHIQGRKITSVEVLLPRQIKWPEPEGFVARILQTTIAGLDRRGKYLLLQLDNQVSLIFHLRMTGQLVYVPSMGQDNSHHNRLIIHLDDGSKLILVIPEPLALYMLCIRMSCGGYRAWQSWGRSLCPQSLRWHICQRLLRGAKPK